MHCGHSYLVENEILSLLEKKCSNAILFNAITDTINNLENTIIELDMQDTILKVLEKL